MARVKKCPECGHLNSVGELYCDDCDCSLSDDDVVDINEQGEYAHEVNEPGEFPREVKCPAEKPGAQANVLDVEAFLEFPWGPVRIGRQLNVGRDTNFSPIAVEIHDNRVSSRHAELLWNGVQLVVRHIGASNPTYVNSKALTTGEEAPVGDWDRISFSRHLTAVVRLKHAR